MKPALACGLAALIGLSACSGVSTGVRSPCFELGGAAVTRGLSFVAGPASPSVATATPTAIPGGADDCDFRDI